LLRGLGLWSDRGPAGAAGARLHLAAAAPARDLGAAVSRGEPRLWSRRLPPTLARMAHGRPCVLPAGAALWSGPGGPARSTARRSAPRPRHLVRAARRPSRDRAPRLRPGGSLRPLTAARQASGPPAPAAGVVGGAGAHWPRPCRAGRASRGRVPAEEPARLPPRCPPRAARSRSRRNGRATGGDRPALPRRRGPAGAERGAQRLRQQPPRRLLG